MDARKVMAFRLDTHQNGWTHLDAVFGTEVNSFYKLFTSTTTSRWSSTIELSCWEAFRRRERECVCVSLDSNERRISIGDAQNSNSGGEQKLA